MSPEDIARAFVAAPGWEWLECMLYRCVSWDASCPSVRVSSRPSHVELMLEAASLLRFAHVLLPKRWPGHSVQVEVFPDGTARVMVFASATSSSNNTGYAVFRISHEPVAVALLRCLEAST